MSQSTYLQFQKKDQNLYQTFNSLQPTFNLNNNPFNIPTNSFNLLNNIYQVPSNVPTVDYSSNPRADPSELLDLMDKKEYLSSHLESSNQYGNVLEQRKIEVSDMSEKMKDQIVLKTRMIQEMEHANNNHDIWIHCMKMFLWVITFWFILTILFGSNKISKMIYIILMIIVLIIFTIYVYILVKKQRINTKFIDDLGSETDELSKEILRMFLSAPSECSKKCSNN